jgi:hypothetical protein
MFYTYESMGCSLYLPWIGRRIGSEIPELDYAEDDAGVSFNARLEV